MKVITQCYITEGQKFVLISDVQNGRRFYGTIPYTNLDNEGRMIRPMNGLEMKISFESAADAMQNRTQDIILDRIIKQYQAAGMSFDDALFAALKDETYRVACR